MKAPSLGSAMLAAVACGEHIKPWSEAAENIVENKRVLLNRKQEAVENYDRLQ